MRMFTKLLSLCLSMVLLLPTMVSASTYNDDPNAEAEQRVQRIEYLLDQRQKLVYSNNPDLEELNDIDVELHNLGVEFYSDAEAAVLFPEATLSLMQDISQESINGSENAVQPTYDIEGLGNGINLWTSYRTSDYNRDDTYLNIQRIEVVPLTEASHLWSEKDSTTLFYDNAYFVATQNFLNVAVSYGLHTLNPAIGTIYDVFAAAIPALLSSTEICVSEIFYRWECKTSVSFAYVRYENQSDDEQRLAVVGTKCNVNVACVMDVESFIQHESGAMIPEPQQYATTYSFTVQPSLYNTNSRAAYVFLHTNQNLLPVYDHIDEIDISAPDDEDAFIIYPPKPLFPLQLD